MKHLISPVQSIIVPKSKYPSEEQAKKYVESLGLDAHFKLHPDSKLSVWRFRQHVPFDKGEYFTKPINGGGKLVIDYAHHTPHQIATVMKQHHNMTLMGQHLPTTAEHQQYSGGGGLHYHDVHNVGKQVHQKEAHIPNIVDMGSFKIDLNAPKRHVPNMVMREEYMKKQQQMPGQNGGGVQKQMPRSSIVNMGTSTIDTNAPSHYVPNNVMKQKYMKMQ